MSCKSDSSPLAGPVNERDKIPGLDVALGGGDGFDFGAFTARVLDVGGAPRHILLQRQCRALRVCEPGMPACVFPESGALRSRWCSLTFLGSRWCLLTFTLTFRFSVALECAHIQGHTKGHIALHFSDQRVAFVGDALFAMGCGRMFEGTYDQMFQVWPLRRARMHGRGASLLRNPAL